MTTRVALAGLLLAGLLLALFLFMKGDGRTQPEAAAGPAAPVGDESPAEAELVASEALDEESAAEDVEIAETEAPVRREAAVDGGVVELFFLDASGAPLADVRWAVFDSRTVANNDTLAQGTTDANGRDRFEAAGGKAQVGVAVPARLPHVEPIEIVPGGGHTVRLPAGAEVSGWVLVDGLRPSDVLDLYLSADDEVAELPRSVKRALGNVSRNRARTKTAADGSFRLTGLDPEWAGTLTWTRGYHLVLEEGVEWAPFGGDELELEAPREGLEIRLERAGRIVGRVVSPADGEPIPRARVRFSWKKGSSSASTSTSASPDGTFSFHVRSSLPDTAELTVSDTDGAGTRILELEFLPGSKLYDAGDVAIVMTREVAYVVRDGRGEAIAGAHARPVSEGSLVRDGAATDSEGRGTVKVSVEELAFRVSAEGYRSAEAPVPLDDTPVEVVLRKGTMIEVAIVDISGEPLEKLSLNLDADEPLFDRDGEPTWDPDFTSARRSSGGWGNAGGGWRELSGAENGRYLVGIIRHGVPFTVSSVDNFGNALASREVPPLSPGEHRFIELVVESTDVVTLEGRVLSPDGYPIEGADVNLTQLAGRYSRGVETDAEGRFRLKGISVPTVTLVASAEGYAPLVLRDWPVPGEPVDLWLEPGHTVRVSVVGPNGEEVPGATVWARTPDVRAAQQRGEEVATGVFDVPNLPDQEVVLQAYFGGSTFELRHDPRVSEATLRVPAWQELVLVVEGAPQLGPGDQLLIRGKSLDLDPIAHVWYGLEDGETEARFDTIFPGRYEFALERGRGPERERIGQPLVTDVGPETPRVTFRP